MYKKIKIHNMNLKKYHLAHICLALDRLNKIDNKKTVILYKKTLSLFRLAPSKVISFLRKIKPRGILVEILVKFQKIKKICCISCENHVIHHYNSEITSVS